MSTLTTYAKAALPLVPGASLLPFVAGRGSEMPALERSADGVAIARDHLAAYAKVCGFTLRDALPATYLHVLAFPLHMQLMTDGRFPFPAVGLVHLENRITVRRPASAGETFALRAHLTPLAPHPKGRTFAIVTTASVAGELVWEDRSTMLKRGSGADAGEAAERPAAPVTAEAQAQWRLPGDLGRRYAAASGDHNPIHLHPYTAKLFGFPRAIAHGMWTKARCLAALEHELPDAYAVDVRFRKPILLPSTVAFAHEQGAFAVRSAKNSDTLHLEGTISS
jgi:acyl dehydratase